MTGPEGDRHYGWWRVLEVAAPSRLEFEDGFADSAGNPMSDMPTTMGAVSIEATESGVTRMTITSVFPSLAAMEELVSMGMEEGMTLAIDQIDALLDETVAPGVGA